LTRAETISGDLTLYTYDPTGNRTAKIVNGEPSTYVNDKVSNRLIRVEGSTNLVTESYDYDAVGSTVSRQSANSADHFVYDARGRLIQANATHYKINAREQRIEKQGQGADTPSGTRHFVYDEMGHLIGEYDPVSGNPVIEHVWLGDNPVAAIKNNQIYYVYPDHLGTPRAITDTGNNTIWYWNYDEPFGETAANENPNGAGVFTYNLRFPGQYFDSETGLHYNWHRDFNPASGKYAQSDPVGLRGGLNTFLYVNGNPVNAIDPTGLFGWGDVIPFWNHYCGGTGASAYALFRSINWGNTQQRISNQISGMVGTSCTDRTIPVDFTMGAQTAGADAYIIGRHTVRARGQIKVRCDCTWDFQGDMSSALGYDPYDFDPSNRGVFGEFLTRVGSARCPSSGRSFNIYLGGGLPMNFSGEIKNGTKTCCP
ncbi:MAG: hypothetical protein LBI35_04885, partial [Burkholderiales bacterium]|nr:hypothetical protein [Burkholderiales bacterium]